MIVTPNDLRKKSKAQLAALFQQVTTAKAMLPVEGPAAARAGGTLALITAEQALRSLQP